MTDPIENKVRTIEALVGEAAAVANRWCMRTVGAEHLLYVLAGTEEGRRLIERRGGSPKAVRVFLEDLFESHREPGVVTGGVALDRGLHRVTQDPIRRAREVARPPQLDDVLQEMAVISGSLPALRNALLLGGIIEDIEEDDPDFACDDILDEDTIPTSGGSGDGLDGADPEGESLDPALDAFLSGQGDDTFDESDFAATDPEEEGVEEACEHTRAVRRAMRDLVAAAREGRLGPVHGREAEIGWMTEALSKHRKSNVILYGDPGVGKTALVEGLAARAAAGEIPASLRDRPIWDVSLSDLVAGARFRGDFEARMQKLMEMAQERRAILFLDEMHLVIGAGSTGGRGMDAANILKPALARGALSVIGATTPGEMREMRKDGALMRRFDQLAVREPRAEEVRDILGSAVDSYALHHGLDIDEEILDLVTDLADRHLPAARFPDKAFGLLDLSCARASCEGRAWLEAEDVRASVERLGGPRLVGPDPDQARRVASLESALESRVFGQPKAVSAMTRAARAALMGLNPGGTAGAYLFNGPTGVGKTEMAAAFADALALPLVRIDMSEFMEKHAVSRLIGAPPGYVGHDEEGLLVQAADTHPEMVLLFDEIEKAHPEVLDILLQILDSGVCRCGGSRLVSFARAHVICTANIGAREAENPRPGFGTRAEDPAERGREALEATLRRELVGRLRNIVQFSTPDEESIRKVVVKELGRLSQRQADGGRSLTWDRDVPAMVAGHVDLGRAGARAIQDTVFEHVTSPLTDALLDAPDARSIHVACSGTRVQIRIAQTGSA